MNEKVSENQIIKVVFCMGSSCFSRGGNRGLELLKAYLKEHDLEDRVHLEGQLCQGRCQHGPNVTLDGTSYEAVNPGVVLDLVKRAIESKD